MTMTPDDDVRGGYPVGGHYPERNGGLLPEDSESSTRPALPVDLAAVQADDAMLDALRLIDRHGCERFTSGRCLDLSSGLRRGAEYGDDTWCAPCVAADALLNGPTGTPEGAPVEQALMVWRREVDAGPMPRLVDTDTALAVLARGRRPESWRHRLVAALRRVWRGDL